MSLIDMNQMEVELIRDEGVVDHAYQDSLGFWTIGVGRLVDARKGGRISPDEIALLLQNDIQKALDDIQEELWFVALETDDQRRAVVNMRFQLGATGLRSFRTFLGLLQQKKFQEAGDSLRNTLWFKQVKRRAERVIAQIQS